MFYWDNYESHPDSKCELVAETLWTIVLTYYKLYSQKLHDPLVNPSNYGKVTMFTGKTHHKWPFVQQPREFTRGYRWGATLYAMFH